VKHTHIFVDDKELDIDGIHYVLSTCKLCGEESVGWWPLNQPPINLSKLIKKRTRYLGKGEV
jgi:hypothetical protein